MLGPAFSARRCVRGSSWQDGSCATQLPPARGKSLWTPSCSALRFSHEKTREESCQYFRQWIQKKGGECANTPRPAGQFPGISHSKVFCPCREFQLLQGPLVIYGSTSRRTRPPRRPPRLARRHLVGTAPYGQPPFGELPQGRSSIMPAAVSRVDTFSS